MIDKYIKKAYNQIKKLGDAMFKDICNFLPKINNYNLFNVINTVCETAQPEKPELAVSATHKMYIVTDGEGIFRNENGEIPLVKGDVIVMPPSVKYTIENTGAITFIYASYLGTRATILTEAYEIDRCGSVFKGYEHLIPMWVSMVNKSFENASIACEGVILYTFSEIGSEIFSKGKEKSLDNAPHRIKSYVDKNLSACELNLKKISTALSYHPKYVSYVFQKEFNININAYIRSLRIQHACTLMEQGITQIKNIAKLSGFQDPLYFSTVFKRETGLSPKDYIKLEINKNSN